jgi:hypothetical protein
LINNSIVLIVHTAIIHLKSKLNNKWKDVINVTKMVVLIVLEDSDLPLNMDFIDIMKILQILLNVLRNLIV